MDDDAPTEHDGTARRLPFVERRNVLGRQGQAVLEVEERLVRRRPSPSRARHRPIFADGKPPGHAVVRVGSTVVIASLSRK